MSHRSTPQRVVKEPSHALAEPRLGRSGDRAFALVHLVSGREMFWAAQVGAGPACELSASDSRFCWSALPALRFMGARAGPNEQGTWIASRARRQESSLSFFLRTEEDEHSSATSPVHSPQNTVQKLCKLPPMYNNVHILNIMF